MVATRTYALLSSAVLSALCVLLVEQQRFARSHTTEWVLPAAATVQTVARQGGEGQSTAEVHRRAAAASGSSASALPAAPASLTLCFGNAGMQEYVLNWLYHAHRVPALQPFFVLALDEELHGALTKLG